MKTLKHILTIILIILLSGTSVYYLKPDNPFFVWLAVTLGALLLFNILIRRSLAFSDYFTSKFNIFTTKVRDEKLFDVPKELLFEKIIEVINDSDLKLVATDKDKFEILAISTVSFKSWGENLYISFKSEGESTLMMFCSTTLFQKYSWGKNEKNISDLIATIESSFVI